MSKLDSATTRGWTGDDAGAAPDAASAYRGAALIRRLERLGPLSSDDRAALGDGIAEIRALPPHQPCIRQGQAPRHVHLMIAGWTTRWQILPDGSRQITGFLIPGDFCNDAASVVHGFDAGVSALGPATVALIAAETVEGWMERPALARAFAWMRLADEAIQRSWVVSIGRRDAYNRLSYLLCQLHARLCAIGQAADDGFVLPATQEHLADALGLTPVHVNRVLKRLREDGLVEIRRTQVHLFDVAALRARAGFADRDVHLSAARVEPPLPAWRTDGWA